MAQPLRVAQRLVETPLRARLREEERRLLPHPAQLEAVRRPAVEGRHRQEVRQRLAVELQQVEGPRVAEVRVLAGLPQVEVRLQMEEQLHLEVRPVVVRLQVVDQLLTVGRVQVEEQQSRQEARRRMGEQLREEGLLLFQVEDRPQTAEARLAEAQPSVGEPMLEEVPLGELLRPAVVQLLAAARQEVSLHCLEVEAPSIQGQSLGRIQSGLQRALGAHLKSPMSRRSHTSLLKPHGRIRLRSMKGRLGNELPSRRRSQRHSQLHLRLRLARQ